MILNRLWLYLVGCLAGTFLCRATPPAGFTLQWSDEFTNNSLNKKNWEYARNGWRNSAYNTSAAVSVTNGCLVITTYTQGGTNFTGFIDSQNLMMRKYGYFEASIEFSNAPGQWSAFWLQSPWMMNVLPDGYLGNTNNNPTNGVEMDIFEHIDETSSGSPYYNGGDSALWWNGYGPQEKGGEVYSTGSLGVGSGFHTYGLLWTTNSYTFYIDGAVKGTSTSGDMISSASQFIRLTSEIESNSWAGTVPAGGYPALTNSPIKMYVDYVRYYWAAPVITQNLPAEVYVPANYNYTYSVGATSSAPDSYQWYIGGSDLILLSQTNSTYTAPPQLANTSREYFVIITNIYGAVTSTVSTLNFIPIPSLTNSYVSNVLTLNWPTNSTGWTLQAQTNGSGAGIGKNWVDVGGSTLTNQAIMPVNVTNGSVFYRLVY